MENFKDNVTLQEIWKLFKEIAYDFKETDRRFKESDLRFKELERFVKERSEETDRMFKESDLRFKELERFVKERSEEADRRFKEMERVIKERSEETNRSLKETSQLVKQTQKAIGDLGNKLGQFVQEMVRPALVKLFRQKNLDVHRVLNNMEAYYEDKGGIEVDLLVINGKEAIVVECKSSLSIDDVNDHIERLNRFKDFWPEYSNLKLYGALAAMIVPNDVSKYAYRQGFYVLAQNGEIVEIKNDDKFKPKVW